MVLGDKMDDKLEEKFGIDGNGWGLLIILLDLRCS